MRSELEFGIKDTSNDDEAQWFGTKNAALEAQAEANRLFGDGAFMLVHRYSLQGEKP